MLDWKDFSVRDKAVRALLELDGGAVAEYLEQQGITEDSDIRSALRFAGSDFLSNFPLSWSLLYERGVLSLGQVSELVERRYYNFDGTKYLLRYIHSREVREAVRAKLSELEKMENG